jgi:hypothetical protein
MVEHVPEQGRKAWTVQPFTTEPSVGPEGGIQNKEEMNHHFIHGRETTN